MIPMSSVLLFYHIFILIQLIKQEDPAKAEPSVKFYVYFVKIYYSNFLILPRLISNVDVLCNSADVVG